MRTNKNRTSFVTFSEVEYKYTAIEGYVRWLNKKYAVKITVKNDLINYTVSFNGKVKQFQTLDELDAYITRLGNKLYEQTKGE